MGAIGQGIKYKDLQKKVNKFNHIYNNKCNMCASGRGDVDVIKATQSEYKKIVKGGIPYLGAWEVLKNHAKWLTVKEM